MLFRSGFDVALAPLGTALTEEQAHLLKKYTNNVILSFDMDEAGQKATERSILILKSAGFNIRVLLYKDAKDPDDYLKKYGKEAFLKVVKDSLEAFDYLYLRYSSEYSLEDHMSKQNFINRFKDFFQCLESDLERSLYIDKLGKSLNIELDVLKSILITNNKKRIKNTYEKKEESKDLDEKGLYNLEKLTLALVLSQNEYIEDFRDKEISSSLGKKIFQYIEFLKENHTIYPALKGPSCCHYLFSVWQIGIFGLCCHRLHSLLPLSAILEGSNGFRVDRLRYL